jgi:hypothetical protein
MLNTIIMARLTKLEVVLDNFQVVRVCAREHMHGSRSLSSIIITASL